MADTYNFRNIIRWAGFLVLSSLFAIACSGDSSDGQQASLAELELLEGSVPVGEYSLQMPAPFEQSGPEKNEFWDIYNTTYTYTTDTQKVVFAIGDETQHFDQGEDAEMQENAASMGFMSNNLESLTSLILAGEDEPKPISSEAISYTPDGSDIELKGHELEYDIFDKQIKVRSFRKDQIVYDLYGENISSEDWDQLVNSLSPHTVDK